LFIEKVFECISLIYIDNSSDKLKFQKNKKKNKKVNKKVNKKSFIKTIELLVKMLRLFNIKQYLGGGYPIISTITRGLK